MALDWTDFKWTWQRFQKLYGITVPASTTSSSKLNLAVGVAPSSPKDGDVWYESGALKFRLGGTTKTFTLT